jgi:hypothetical protein
MKNFVPELLYSRLNISKLQTKNSEQNRICRKMATAFLSIIDKNEIRSLKLILYLCLEGFF